MIFVTIGTQEPFDRLIKAVDEIAPMLNVPIIAQVSNSNYCAKNIKTVSFLPPSEFVTYFEAADLIISHAGMGTIISALEIEKPIIVMPRKVECKEHRNNHQLATAKSFDTLQYIHVAYDEVELKQKLIYQSIPEFKCLHKLGKFASSELIGSIHQFITSNKKKRTLFKKNKSKDVEYSEDKPVHSNTKLQVPY